MDSTVNILGITVTHFIAFIVHVLCAKYKESHSQEERQNKDSWSQGILNLVGKNDIHR